MENKKKKDIIIGSSAICFNLLGLICMAINGNLSEIFSNIPFFIGATLLIWLGIYLILRKSKK